MKLENFCGSKDRRPHIAKPFSQADHTYATNGSLIVRVPKVDGYDPDANVKYPNAGGLSWDHSTITDWEDPPKGVLSGLPQCDVCEGTKKASECDECEGEGEVTFNNGFHTYECECQSCNGIGFNKGGEDDCPECDGTGKDLKNSRIAFGNRDFSAHYIRKIKQTLTDVKFSRKGDGDDCAPMRFKFNGGEGILMPMQKL